jgi:hypothetical protein
MSDRLIGYYPLKSTGAGFSIKNIEIDPPIVKLSGTNGTKILNDEFPMYIGLEEIESELHQIAYFNIGNHQYYKLDLKGQPMELEI